MAISKKKSAQKARKILTHPKRVSRLKAVTEGSVEFGRILISCAVLNDEDETTVFSVRALEFAMGFPRPTGAKKGKPVDSSLPTIMRQDDVKPYIGKYLNLATFEPIHFSLQRGGNAFGITVEDADKVMQGWIDAYADGALKKPRQIQIAKNIQAMKNAASVSGFTQVIHEQLGYVDKRRKTITELFNSIFEKNYHAWAQQFDIEFYERIYLLKGKEGEWRGLLTKVEASSIKPPTPSWIGRVTNDIIYRRLQPPGILEILQKKNPRKPGKKGRERKYHQHLTKDKGLRILSQHMGGVLMLMRIYKTWDEFYAHLDKVHPPQDGQERFYFMGDDE